MNRLYLANPDTRTMAPSPQELSDLVLQKSAASAKRMLWMTEPGDAIVTPTGISPAFHSYVADLKGPRTTSPPRPTQPTVVPARDQ